jgi:hypothetical protein
MPSVTINSNILSVTMRSAVMLCVVAPITVMPISVVPNNLLYDRCREEFYPRKSWFCIKTLSMAAFSMKSLFATRRINAGGRKLILSITIRGIKYRHAECYILFMFILIVVMLSVITLNVVMLSDVGPSLSIYLSLSLSVFPFPCFIRNPLTIFISTSPFPSNSPF